MNKVIKKTAAILMSVAMAFSALPSSYAAISGDSDTSYSVQQKTQTAARLDASSSGGTYAAVLRSDKVGNDAQTTTTSGYNQQVETKLSEASGNVSASYFEQDKYISDPTGEKNGQSTYNITIENAYVGPSVQLQAPDGQDIIIIEDASSSMAGHVSAENEAVRSVAENIKKTNLQRIENAMNDVYADIDPTGKTKDQIKQEMINKGHLLRVVGVESFNESTKLRYSSKTYLLTDSEVSSLASAAALKDDQTSRGGDLQDLTRTDYALQDITGKYNLISDASKTSVVLITDGAPYDWNNSITNGVLMSSGATNNALKAATALKAQGVTIFTAYAPWDANGNVDDYNQAVKQSDVAVLAPNGKITDDKNFAAVFMSIVSSDYTNGQFGVKSGSTMFSNTVTYSSTGKGFGKYSKIIWDADDFITSIAAITKSLDTMTIQSAIGDAGYASLESYVLDDISHPFGLNGTIDNIKVYQVPRVPKNLDSTGHPADASNVTAFTWGEKEDITDQVEVSYYDNRIKVTGYNYELNALTTYDHDLALSEDKQGADPTAYKKGDYGYKLVIEFPIYAKYSFGGNDIETNDSTTSGFYPSTPGKNSGKTTWTGNTSLNPNGSKYVALYPVPTVDLKVNYSIVSDSTTLYAPSTEKLKDLVTNPSSDPDQVYIFDVGSTSEYHKLYEEYKQAQASIKVMQEKYDAAYAKYSADSSAENFAAVNTAQSDLSSALLYQDEAKEALSKPQNYIPNGENNAYVDITYTLTSPSGKVIGTMNIPHGTNTSDAPDGSGDIHWTFTDGADPNISESGTYKIVATVTPVQTTREESYTGSSNADDTCPAKTYTANPTAYIYVLQVKVKDTTRKQGASLDFTESGYDLFSASKSSDWQDVHFVETKWVPLGGDTPESTAANEPGLQSQTESDLKKIATGKAPTGTVTIKNGENVSGTGTKYVSKTAKDGSYIPAAVEIHRMAGSMNKTDPSSDKDNLTDRAMSDDDHLYGDRSSVVWVHECDVANDCNNNEFKDSHNKNDGGKTTGANITRFLIHISDSYVPNVDKSTSTPTIDVGGDIQWKVTVRNDNVKENKNHKTTRAQMLDVLPYQNDGRENPNNNKEGGSSFGSELYFKTISVDCSSATAMVTAYQNGSAKLYYTTDTAVRTATREQWYDGGNIKWTQATPSVNGNTVTFSVPKNAVAIKSDTTLAWNEKLVFNLTANVKDTSLQKTHDVYINQALVGNEDITRASDPVVTELVPVAITGTIWYDNNGNGQMDGSEERASGITVSLYKDWSNESTDHITLGDRNLEKVYNAKEELVSSYVTGTNGYFEFNNLPAGKYYVVATGISSDYKVTKKQKSGTDNALNSKAEESMPTGQTAWIRDIYVGSSSVPYQNIGLVVQKGTVTITKVMENGKLYSTASMTDEQKAALSKNFVFNLRNNNTGMEYSASVVVNSDNVNGVSAKFEDIPLGTYTLSETTSLGYEVASMDVVQGNVQYSKSSKTATIYISAGETDVDITVNNRTTETDPGVYPGSGVINHVGTALPIAFEVIYAHGDINDQNAVSYTFKQSDFSNMKVTYDDGTYRDFNGTYKVNADGTTQKVSNDTLKFSEVTLSPSTITNERNTADSGNEVSVNAYFTERNKTLSSKFTMRVNLKPIHKFTVVFHANGSTFAGSTDTNSVRFGYNDITGKNDIISGVYRNPDGHSGWNFVGWNTASDGSGVNYDSLTALNEIGSNQRNVTQIDLYAHWTTTVTFNANGGTNYQNGTAVTNPYTITWDVHRKINSAGMSAQRAATSEATFAYKGWYTTAITVTAGSTVSGTSIDNYGTIEGPTTFYAAWRMGYTIQKFHYTGGAQTYTAPISGTYVVSLYGARGGQDGDNKGGEGGYLKGTMYLQAGQSLTIYVGGHGELREGYAPGGYNGGGGATGSGSGGGCTDIYLSGTRIAAAGGGGGDCDSSGGDGGRKNARLCGTTDNITGSKNGGTSPYTGNSSGSAGGGGGGWNGGSAVSFDNNRGNTGYGGTNGYNSSYFTKIEESRNAKSSGSEAPYIMAATSWDPIQVYNGFASILPPAD